MVNNKGIIFLTLIVAGFLFGATVALADPLAPTTLSPQQSSARDLSGLAAQSADARGGNVTQINIQALTITRSWQGYYGDISGEITLDDGSNNTFYNWSVVTVDGEVYATRATSVTWAGVQCANGTEIGNEETYLGQTATDGDSVTNTFSLTAHPAFTAGSAALAVNNCSTTYGFEDNATQSINWVQALLYDYTGGAIVYSTLINDTQTGFDGGSYDFQLLVGENEKSGSEGITSYYFWVELE